jgi:uncharacterized protein
MASQTLRRTFLGTALALPAAGRTLSAGTELPKRTLGKTGLKVTTIGSGCAWTADPSVFTRALDAGINHFDTAPVYQGGNSEAMVRAGIGDRRKQIVLSTKTEASRRDEALAQLDRSLRELGTGYVDVWYLHGKDRPEGITDELIEALETAKKQGKTRFIGVTTHRLPQTVDAILKTGRMDVVMAACNFTMSDAVEAAAARLQNAGIGLVLMKALAGGRSPASWPEKGSGRRLVERPEAAGAALHWAFQKTVFASVVVGMISHDEVDDDLGHARSPFSDADRKTLGARLIDIRPYYCRMCGSCDGACPRGLPVSDVLRYAMYATSYGQFADARQHFQLLPAAAREVRCADCASCAVRCPNGVRVRERLTAAQEWLA